MLELQKAETNTYEIVVDSSGFCTDMELPVYWIQLLLTCLPIEYFKNLERIIIFSPNLPLSKYLKRLSYIFSSAYGIA